MVGNAVLIANVSADLMKNFRELRLKPRKVSAPASQASESIHLVVSLQVIHLIDWDAHAMRSRPTPRFEIFPDRPSHADREDGYILRRLDLLRDLVEIEFAESIDPGGNQNDVLVALNAVYPIQRIVKRVEQIGFRKTRYPQLVQRAISFLFVLRKVGQNVIPHVVRDDRQPIIFFQRAYERIRRMQNVVHEKVIASRKLDQQNGSNWRF